MNVARMCIIEATYTNLPQGVTYHVLVLFFQGEKGESDIQGRNEKVCKLPLAIITEKNIIKISLTLKMTTAQVVETSVTVNNNSPIQDYVHPNDQTQPTFEMTPGFKPFTKIS